MPAAARITVPASVVAQQVPHAATAALVADSVYAAQVPAAARITVPASVVAQQVPTALPELTVPHGALAAQAAELASAPLTVPASVVAQQVPTALPELTVPHGALAAQAAELAPLTSAQEEGRAAIGRPTRVFGACATLTPVEIVIDGSERPDDAGQLRDRLHSYNEERTGYRDGRPLNCFLRDPDGSLAAGLDGFTWGGYGRIEYLWVDDAASGARPRSPSVEAAVAEARRRGCRTIVLDTHTFQAPGFYSALGFVEVGRTTGTPRGYDQVLMQLDLDVEGPVRRWLR